MTELPKPLTPPDSDLRGYGFMPLYGHRPFSSDFNALCNDATAKIAAYASRRTTAEAERRRSVPRPIHTRNGPFDCGRMLGEELEVAERGEGPWPSADASNA